MQAGVQYDGTPAEGSDWDPVWRVVADVFRDMQKCKERCDAGTFTFNKLRDVLQNTISAFPHGEAQQQCLSIVKEMRDHPYSVNNPEAYLVHAHQAEFLWSHGADTPSWLKQAYDGEEVACFANLPWNFSLSPVEGRELDEYECYQCGEPLIAILPPYSLQHKGRFWCNACITKGGAPVVPMDESPMHPHGPEVAQEEDNEELQGG